MSSTLPSTSHDCVYELDLDLGLSFFLKAKSKNAAVSRVIKGMLERLQDVCFEAWVAADLNEQPWRIPVRKTLPHGLHHGCQARPREIATSAQLTGVRSGGAALLMHTRRVRHNLFMSAFSNRKMYSCSLAIYSTVLG
jgi:hypothetical protein